MLHVSILSNIDTRAHCAPQPWSGGLEGLLGRRANAGTATMVAVGSFHHVSLRLMIASHLLSCMHSIRWATLLLHLAIPYGARFTSEENRAFEDLL